MSEGGGFPGRPGGAALPPTGVPPLPPGLLTPPPGMAGGDEADRPDVSSNLAPSHPFTSGVRPARSARRVAAFSIDVAVMAAAFGIVLAVTGSAVFGILALVETAIGLTVLQARTGITVGNGLLRVRTARDDAPFSPGIGRTFVRAIVTGAGFLAGVGGAWLVVASSGWDASGRGQSWADKAARTVVVQIPRGPAAVPTKAPTASIALAAPHLVTPRTRSTLAEDAVNVSFTGAPSRQVEPAQSAPLASTGPKQGRRSIGVPPVDASAGGTDLLDGPAENGALLLIFDTGQREQLSIPVVVNLGRNPAATEQGDRLVTVDDQEFSVSKTHVRLEHSRGRTWITDMGSTNGTEIRSDDDGPAAAPLETGHRVLLGEGDRVRVGNRTFTVSLLMAHENNGAENES